MPDSWTRTEVEATVTDYFVMLNLELRGLQYNKSDHRRHLAAQLDQRSDGAIERKHQNISAVLIELGFAYISGYKPLSNYQQLLFDVVSDRLDNSRGLVDIVRSQIAEPAKLPRFEDIMTAMVAPPTAEPDSQRYRSPQLRERAPRPTRINYLELEARNRSLGAAGEEFVVQLETARLARAGFERLAMQVERVSETRGDGLGFDVLSFETTGEERLIEVKTTAYGASTPFFVTTNEVRVSERDEGRFHLYRAFDFRRHARVFAKKGALTKSFKLEPSQFVARIG
jgi:hypothetical protein